MRSLIRLITSPARLPSLTMSRRISRNSFSIEHLGAEEAQRGLRVGDGGADRLLHFMGDRGRELTHRGDAISVRELHLGLAVGAARWRAASLPPACARSGRGQRRRPSSAFHSKSAAPTRTGTRLPSLRKYSFSSGWRVPVAFSSAMACSSASRHSAGVSSVHRSRPETRSSRAYPTISRKASLASMIRPSNIPDQDPDDVRIDQAPDPGLAFLEIVVQTGVLQRDRRLRGQQFQHRDPGGREHVRCQVVLEIEHADQLGLLHQGQAEDGPGVASGGCTHPPRNGFCAEASSRITLSRVRMT